MSGADKSRIVIVGAITFAFVIGAISWLYSTKQYAQTIFLPFSPELVWNKTDAYVVMPLQMVKYGPFLNQHEKYEAWKTSARFYRELSDQIVLSFSLVIHIKSGGQTHIAYAPEFLWGIQEYEGAMYISGPCEDTDHLRLCWKLVDGRLSKTDCTLAAEIDEKTGLQSENRKRTGYKDSTIECFDKAEGVGPTFELSGKSYAITWSTINSRLVLSLRSDQALRPLVSIPNIRSAGEAIKGGRRSVVDPEPCLELFKVK